MLTEHLKNKVLKTYHDSSRALRHHEAENATAQKQVGDVGNSPGHIWMNTGLQTVPIFWAARFSTSQLSSRPPACTVFSSPHPHLQAPGRRPERLVLVSRSCPAPPPHLGAAGNSSSNTPPRPSHQCPRRQAPLQTGGRKHRWDSATSQCGNS